MKTLLKSLAVAALLMTGATALTPAAAHADPLVVVNEGHRGHYDHYRRGPYHRGYYRGGYGRHCETHVWYRHGYRHVTRHCW